MSLFQSGLFGNGLFGNGLLGGLQPDPVVTTPLDPPGTTGTTTFAPQIVDLFEEAFERAGSELRSGYDFRTARRSMNLLTIEWASRGVNLWTIEQGSTALTAGTASYNLPADTVDLLDHVIRQNDGNVATQSDLSITRISFPTYAAIPNKLARGRPVQLTILRKTGVNTPTGVAYPTVTVWPVPDNATYTLVYWRMRRIQDAGNANNLADIPFRFLPCLVAGLAYHIAMKVPGGMDRLPILKAEYEQQWDIAAGEDRDRASVFFRPRVYS